jgi:hypothetical protein
MNSIVKIYHGKDCQKLFSNKHVVPLTDAEKKQIVSCLEPIEILSLFFGYACRETTSDMVESMYERLEMHKFIIISDQDELDDEYTVEEIQVQLNRQKEHYALGKYSSEKIDMGVHVYHQKDVNNMCEEKKISPLSESEQKEIVSSLEPDDILSIFYGYYNGRESGADMVESLHTKLKMDRFSVMTEDNLIERLEEPSVYLAY